MNTRPPISYEDREPVKNGALLGLPTRDLITQEGDRNILRAYALTLLAEVEDLIAHIREIAK